MQTQTAAEKLGLTAEEYSVLQRARHAYNVRSAVANRKLVRELVAADEAGALSALLA